MTNVDDPSSIKELTVWPELYNGAIYLPFTYDAALCHCYDEHRNPIAADYRQKNTFLLETTCTETHLMTRARITRTRMTM